MLRRGVSIIEVLIAVVIIAIALLAMGRLHITNLQVSKEAVQAREATEVSRGFVERLRGDFASIPTLCNGSRTVSGFTLTCTRTACQSLGNNGVCSAGSSPVAYEVALQTTRNSKIYINLSTLIAQP